jgi:predicted DNA-binding transcriptional regulator YafY
MGMSQFQLELLKKLPREPQAAITMTDLAYALRAHWGKASSIENMRKKIKNNLNTIAKIYPNSLDGQTGQKEHFYRLKAEAPMMLMPMSQEQMMAFGLLSKFGTDLLPKQAHRALSPFFEAARQTAVDAVSAFRAGAHVPDEVGRKWLAKIAVVPAVLPFCPPLVDDTVKQTVQGALLREESLRIRFVHAADPTEEECVVSPLALIQQGVRTYLVAKKRGKKTADRFLLARIRAAEVVIGFPESPEHWDLNQFLAKGISHPVFPVDIYGKTERVELKVNAGTQWIKETPLAPGQTHQDEADGSYFLYVDMPITEELVRWLLSMAFHVQALKPDYLATRLKSDLAAAAAMYK